MIAVENGRRYLAKKIAKASFFVIIIGIGGTLVPQPSDALAQEQGGASDQAVLDRIFADWERRREQARAVHYRVEGTMLVPKGTFDGDPLLPKSAGGVALKEDYVHPYAADLLLDFDNNRFRFEIESENFNLSDVRFHPVHDLWAFDGSDLRCARIGVTENRGTHYSVAQSEFYYEKLDYPLFTTPRYPALVGHGVILLDSRLDRIQHIGGPLPRDRIFLRGKAVWKGRSCMVLRTSLPTHRASGVFSELWVDPERGSSVVRVLRYAGAGERPVLQSFLNIDYRESPEGWFPTTYQYTRMLSEVPLRVLNARVQELELNPPLREEDFAVQPDVGMVVTDSREGLAYVLGEGGERLPYSTIFPQAEEAPPYGNTWIWVGLALSCGLFLLAVVFVKRRIRSAR